MRDLVFVLLISTHISGILSQTGCNMWDAKCTTATAKRIAPSFIQIVNEAGYPLDPMIFNLIQIHEEGLHMMTQDVKIHGLSNYILDHLSFDKLANNMSRIIIHTDFYLTGLYKSNGTVLSCPMYGDGVFRVALKNTELEIIAKVDRGRQLDGTEYDTIKDYQFRYEVKDKADYQFENLYYGDKELSDRMHYMLNTYWKIIIDIHGRRHMRLIADTFVKAIRVYLKKVPLSVFFTS